MDLGEFSISLTVKKIKKSKKFYQKFGFKVIDGSEDEKWLIMQNGKSIIGLFQDMFDMNIIKFHPPKDVPALQKNLKSKGIKILKETDETKTGPGSFALEDPDGNMILVDCFS